MDFSENTSDDTLQTHQNDPSAGSVPLEATTIELHGDEFWPLSGKPYFHAMITEACLRFYQLVVPVRIQRLLPNGNIPASLTCGGQEWEMMYSGKGPQKRINRGWKEFAIDNHLRVGDACVFELTKSRVRKLHFRVQILRGDLPPQFQQCMDHEAANSPIID